MAEDDDRPWKKRRDEDAEDDRPRRRRDEDDDRPRRRRDDEDDWGDWDETDRRRKLPREVLRGIAKSQKGIIVCILISFCLVPVLFLAPEDVRIVPALALIPLNIAATVFVFLLATKVYSTATGVVLGILTFIPCIGLLVLLAINGKATTILKENGIPVGFLGVNSSDI